MTVDSIIGGVEWYDGHQGHSGLRRVQVRGVWYDVITYDRTIHEDVVTYRRTVHYHCCLSGGQVITMIHMQP
ncbi:hypothetical protein JXB22_01995 [candidate division WOR-3 bacterium]|nr:hypothetical protein [candidate division WOR-3 bacterium]